MCTIHTNTTYSVHQTLPHSQSPAESKLNFTNIFNMPSAHTWSIAKDQNLVSIPSEKDNHPSTEYPSPLLSFSPHFPYIFFALSSYGGFSLFNFLLLTIFLWQNEFYMEHAQKLEEVRSVLKEVGEDTLEALLMMIE
ncbi:hypothetical protein CK203_102695 [Vitis vinifera]|uniref:Uncharacterized protein n=1 Tax=Vitis vinifera TaxID=29760 RepID=A0A438FFH3_VITVI|nr:hypothetical protein CK203_102695 [Vitis vinifera]